MRQTLKSWLRAAVDYFGQGEATRLPPSKPDIPRTTQLLDSTIVGFIERSPCWIAMVTTTTNALSRARNTS
jgi:hypothetical protein